VDKITAGFYIGDMQEFIAIGHRGACGYEPENTLSSFDKAVSLGCPWVELDVYAIEDELLVIHDDSLERTTNGHGQVQECSLEYLRSLDAGNGQQIPTLKEVADLIDRRAGINIELKGKNTAAPASQFVADACKNGWKPEQFLLSSFNHRELAAADKAWRRGALFHRPADDYFARTAELEAYALNLSLRIVDQQTVEAAHERGLKVFVYTVNETEDLQRMMAIGVDGVFSDYPDRALQIVTG